MAVTFEEYTGGSGSATSGSLSVPAGISADDVLIAVLTHSGWSASITPPSGWTTIYEGQSPSGGYDHRTWFGYKIATGSESGSFTWTFGGSVYWAASMCRYSGADGIDVHAYTLDGGSARQSPSVTTTVDNCMIVAGYATENPISMAYGPSGMTNRGGDAPGTTSWYPQTSLADKIQASAGASGTFSWGGGDTNENDTLTVAIKPASTGITATPDPVSASAAVVAPGTLKAASVNPVASVSSVVAAGTSKSLSVPPVLASASTTTPAELKSAQPSPVVVSAAVASPSTAKIASLDPVLASAGVATPTLPMIAAPLPVVLTSGCSGPETAKVTIPDPVSLAAQITLSGSAKSAAVLPVVLSAGVGVPSFAGGDIPSPVVASASVVSPSSQKIATASPVSLSAVIPAPITMTVYAGVNIEETILISSIAQATWIEP